MFNSTAVNKMVVSNHINAVTGNITKTYVESFFKRFNLKSRMADDLFSPNSRMKLELKGKEYESTYDVVVIQMVVVGDMEVIAEIIMKSDYDEIFEED